MHACWEGVVKQFLGYWFDPHYKQPCYVKNWNTFEQILKNIKFPHDFSHPVRSYATFGAYWKGKPSMLSKFDSCVAAELKNFAMIIFPSIMNRFLERKYYLHFLLFVDAMDILTARSINMIDLAVARKKLLSFVKQTEDLYGRVTYSNFCIHSITQSLR
jgi:hypothetical protein